MTFKNKTALIDFVKHQTSVTLDNDPQNALNNKRTVLHTDVKRVYKNEVLGLFHKYGIKYESHINDSYFVYLR